MEESTGAPLSQKSQKEPNDWLKRVMWSVIPEMGFSTTVLVHPVHFKLKEMQVNKYNRKYIYFFV